MGFELVVTVGNTADEARVKQGSPRTGCGHALVHGATCIGELNAMHAPGRRGRNPGMHVCDTIRPGPADAGATLGLLRELGRNLSLSRTAAALLGASQDGEGAATERGSTPPATAVGRPDAAPDGAAGAPGLRQARYDAYLRSAAWRGSPARTRELHLSGARCRLCSRGSPEVRTEVHHNTYARFGRERPEDLCTICSECHAGVTDMLRRRRYAAPPPAPGDTPRVLPGRVLADQAGRGAGDAG